MSGHLDYQHDATNDGRELKFLNVVDEFTREALAIEVDRTINAEQTVAVLARLAAERGAPVNLRCDNGPSQNIERLCSEAAFCRALRRQPDPGRLRQAWPLPPESWGVIAKPT
jgi:putative transposase